MPEEPLDRPNRTTWGKIRSWHIVRTWTRVSGGAIALCGKSMKMDPTAYRDEPPWSERSCETCLRIWDRAEG